MTYARLIPTSSLPHFTWQQHSLQYVILSVLILFLRLLSYQVQAADSQIYIFSASLPLDC